MGISIYESLRLCLIISVGTNLVDLLVYGGVDFLMLLRPNSLVLYGRVNTLVDGGVVVSRLGHEVLDSFLGLVHFDSSFAVCVQGVFSRGIMATSFLTE